MSIDDQEDPNAPWSYVKFDTSIVSRLGYVMNIERYEDRMARIPPEIYLFLIIYVICTVYFD